MKKYAIHINTLKQYLETAAIGFHYLSAPILLQITGKYFNFQLTAV